MLGTNSLAPPKTGRSRFSKALPAVPGLEDNYTDDDDDDDSPPPSPPKDFRLPPPRKDSMANAKPPNASLPSLPLLKTGIAPPSAPPKMAIPRRPVGKPMAQSRPPQQPLPESPIVPSSPSESLSSILSAYSRSSGESLVRSSVAATSGRESNATTSPSDEAALRGSKTEAPIPSSFPAARKPIAPSQAQKLPPKPDSGDAPPPPPPSKDEKYRPLTSHSPERKARPDVHSSASPPRPQIWRRRSLKADLSLELPDLQLVTSHGSTAASQPIAQPATQPTAQPVQSQLPAGVVKVTPLHFQPARTTVGLPGRNIRPQQPPQKQPQQQEQPSETAKAMGNQASQLSQTSHSHTPSNSTASKLKNLKGKLHFHRRGASSSDTTSETASRPVAQRPPTPDYQKQDIKTPIMDTFVSPVSPASSPELPSEVSPVIPNNLEPQHSPGTLSIEPKPVARKALPPPPKDLDPPKLLPDLKVTLQMPTSLEPISAPAPAPPPVSAPVPTPIPTPASDSAGNRSSAGSDTASSRTRQSQQSVDPIPSRFPPRGSSIRSDVSRVYKQPRQPQVDLDPRLVPSESGPLYRGRDGTLYPEMKVQHEPDPRAYYFPKQADDLAAEGTIIKAAPLKGSHFNCYHGHKTMNKRSNKHYPLTCQTCDRADAEDRWACSFCHLRVCESCLKSLNGHQRDLQKLVDEIRGAALS